MKIQCASSLVSEARTITSGTELVSSRAAHPCTTQTGSLFRLASASLSPPSLAPSNS